MLPVQAGSFCLLNSQGGADRLMIFPDFAMQRPAIFGVRRPKNRLGLRRSPAPVRVLKVGFPPNPPLTARSSQTVYARIKGNRTRKFPAKGFSGAVPRFLGFDAPKIALGFAEAPLSAAKPCPQIAPLAVGTRRGFCGLRCACGCRQSALHIELHIESVLILLKINKISRGT